MNRECYSCHNKKAYVDKRGIEHWRIVDGNHWCDRCFHTHYSNKTINPDIKKKWNKINNPKKIKFLRKRIYFSWLIRNYVCSWCNAKSEMTDMHHLAYWPCMPWVSMVELCRKCHTKTKNMRNQYSK